MADNEAVLPDTRVGAAASSLLAKPEEWSPEVREAVRLVISREILAVRATLTDGSGLVQHGMEDLDFQQLLAGLRKLLVAGLLAKDLADQLLRWYGPEASGL